MSRPSQADIARQVGEALSEDLGSGDLTAALIPPATIADARLIVREPAVLCGVDWFDEVFRQVDGDIGIQWYAGDGDRLEPGQCVCRLHGPARSLLSGERAALNFLQTLSGTATQTARYVEAVQGTSAVVLDTRKTIPGLRLAQKYAVTCGGGHNHRIGLFDAILIKENHIRAAGSVTAAMQAALRMAPPGMMIEIEVETLAQLEEALQAGAKRILLDNFDNETLRAAVAQTGGRAALEASGGVNLQSIGEIARTGVDFISVGQLTKDLRATDFSMLFETR